MHLFKPQPYLFCFNDLISAEYVRPVALDGAYAAPANV